MLRNDSSHACDELARPVVALTAARQRCEELAAHVRACGGEPSDHPLVEVVFRLDALRALDSEMRCEAIAFTSRTAVEACERAWGLEALRARCEHRFIAAVGAGTASQLERCGIRVDLVPAQADAESLAAELVPRQRGRSILLPISARSDGALERSLRAGGALVHRVDSYDMETAPRAVAEQLELDLARGHVDAITFLAGSAVDAFVERIGAARARAGIECSRAVVLGKTAHDALLRIGITPFATSPETTLASIARIACDAGRHRKRNV